MKGLIRSVLFIVFYAYLKGHAVYAQEKPYKQALDSLSTYFQHFYIEEGRHDSIVMLSYYAPIMLNRMSEEYERSAYIGMSYNYKTTIVLSDGFQLYALDLKKMDTTFIQELQGICIVNPANNESLRYSAVSRIFNGKYGGVSTKKICLKHQPLTDGKPFSPETSACNYSKVAYFLKEAIVYAKKTNTPKNKIWKPWYE